ncbi:histone deacetylase 6 isoform X2 [Leptopilina boulardi]|uniref:histone deacetylase 6 isoform X2 n=1 Tax=Leptopilina boulardi TaxID=63433 RepID=UPI0021F617E3|nr:histone deacetylase 6 isoform X2 [Leptopilina boulardi]
MASKKKLINKKKLQKENQYISPVHDIYDNAISSKVLQRLSTGLVYDLTMIEHRCLWDLNYQECPDRFQKVLDRCNELQLVDRCKIIESRFADEEELLLKHNREHIQFLKSTESIKDVNKLEELSSRYDAVYFHPSTYRQSLKAVGSTINLVTSICKGEIQNGMAIIRPPGHHAMKAEFCGYCFFNNVAIACEKMLNMNLAKKILIIDWDVHHGQATQQMFYNDSRVVYFSIHRYENGEFWPNLRESDYDYIGLGPGEGYNFNVPLNKTGMTNADYIAIFQQVLLPMAYEFQPDLVVVSAGYDAALGCPEGEMEITPACYSHLLWSLMSLAKGKVAVILEGGYCLESLSEGAALTLRALLGDPCPRLLPILEPCDSICKTILNVIYTHRSYWKCYQFQGSYSICSKIFDEECEKRYLPICIYNNSNVVQTTHETRNCYPAQSIEKKAEIREALSTLKQCTNLNKSQYKLCIVYDSRMLKHFDNSDDCHPEKPSRIANIYASLQEYGVLKRCLILQLWNFNTRW